MQDSLSKQVFCGL